ncbi:uncharacterized protein G2W53_033332 [Senna tora]|uniref:Uncharacterized protein n=1 Tax=Senna tora TaxID=362788 RepID=A0A834T0Z5_9FABA|nr:uncharacterized protein G2W53_033332 [Senna tora]
MEVHKIGEANHGVAETAISGLPFAVHSHHEWSHCQLKTEDGDSKFDTVRGVDGDVVRCWRSRTASTKILGQVESWFTLP